MDYGRFYFKICIFVIQYSFLYSLSDISLVYNLHIEKHVVFDYFFKFNAVSFRCFIDNFDVLSTKVQLVDESLGEALLGDTQTPRPLFFRLPPLED